MKIAIEDQGAGRVSLHFYTEGAPTPDPTAASYVGPVAHLKEALDIGLKQIFPSQTYKLYSDPSEGMTTVAFKRVVLDTCVFPSNESSIVSIITDEKFDGAHNYEIKPMLRYDNGAVYGLEGLPLTFVKKNDDGTWQTGVQTEQLLLVIADRHPKLNAVFPAEEHDEFMAHIHGALECLGRRFKKRLDRGVAGEHKA